MKDSYDAILIGDVHAPAIHKRAWSALLRLIDDVRPHTVGQVGDFGEFHAVSQHPKTFGKARAFFLELKEVQARSRELWGRQGAARRARRKVQLQGNHEEAYERYVARNAPQLEGLVPNGRELLDLPDDVEWHHFRTSTPPKVGDFTLLHAARSSVQSTTAAARQCVAYGHTHKAGLIYRGDFEGSSIAALNVGWMGDAEHMQQLYAGKLDTVDWQIAFAHLRVTPKGTWASIVPWVNNQFIFRETTYR